MEEVSVLIGKSQSGDKEAREVLIEKNLGLVHHIVKRFLGRGYDPEDLFQIGVIGLMKAIDKFDLKLEVRFSTYAVPMIIGEIRRYLRDNNSVRVSRSMRDTAYHAMQAKERLINELQRDPTIEEIAKELDLPKETVVLAMESIVEPVSLYEPVYSDGGDTIYVMDQIGDQNSDDSWVDEILLRQSISNLNPREKKILHLRFMEIGISQAQVSRLEKGALSQIKNQEG